MRISSPGAAAAMASWIRVNCALGHSSLSSSTTSWAPRAGRAVAGQTRGDTRIKANVRGDTSLDFMVSCLALECLRTRTRARMQQLEVAPADSGPNFDHSQNQEVGLECAESSRRLRSGQ